MNKPGIVMILLVATLATPLEYIFAQTATPLPPTNLAASAASATQINLSWTAPVNATSSGVSGYKIEWDAGCIGMFVTLVANHTATTYSSTNLVSGACYSYRVSALNNAGTSGPSNIATATTPSIPSAPTGVTVATTATTARISWNAPSDGGSDITGYQIQRNGTILVQNTANNKTAYTDSNLKPMTQQTYRIAAWNGVGLGAFSANVTAKTNSTAGNPFDKDSFGQAVSDFVHKRNELFKQQRDETVKVIRECNDKAQNANYTQRKQIREDCRELLNEIKEKYKEARKQFQQQFKDFREATKTAVKDAQKAKIIEKHDVKDVKHAMKTLEKVVKKAEKQMKEDIKEFKKDQKELKKEDKGKKKERHEDD